MWTSLRLALILVMNVCLCCGPQATQGELAVAQDISTDFNVLAGKEKHRKGSADVGARSHAIGGR